MKYMMEQYTHMHLDDAVTEGYQEARDIIEGIDPNRDEYFLTLARLYYAGAKLFLTATYIPMMIHSVTNPDAWVDVDPEDLPRNYHVSPERKEEPLKLPRALLERTNRLNELELHFELFQKMYREKESDEYIPFTAILQQELIHAMLFYARMVHIAPEDAIA
jgi:hypothetical protein